MKNYLAIDIGGTSIKFGIITDSGEVIKSEIQEHNYEKIYELKNGLLKIVEDVRKEYEIQGVGISSPGSVDSKTKIIHGASALPFIHENNWVQEFEEEVKLKVSIENDANCACLCETWLGNAKGLKNVVSVVIGSGVGGSIIINGDLIVGKNLYGGEFGYQIEAGFDPNNTISNNLSTRALVKKVSKEVEVKNGLEVFKKYEEGDERVIHIVEEYFKEVSVFIYNISHILDPDIILIGGAISKQKDILTKIKFYYNELLSNSISNLQLSINRCKFDNNSNLLGAIYNYKKEYDEI